MRPFRFPPLRLALAAVSTVALVGCATELKPKSEAIDEALVLGEEATAALEAEGIEPITFLEVVDDPCESEEAVMYRMVARYAVDVEPSESAGVLASIHEFWVEELGYQEVDDGIFWGQSDYALSRVRDGDVRYSATRQPGRATITIGVDTGCFEDPDEEDWFDPVSPTASPFTP